MTINEIILAIGIAYITFLLSGFLITMQITFLYNKKLWRRRRKEGFHSYNHEIETREALGYINWKSWYLWISEDTAYLNDNVWNTQQTGERKWK